MRHSRSRLDKTRLAPSSHAADQVLYRLAVPRTHLRHATGSTFASGHSPLDPILHPSGLRFDDPQQVREYLKSWSKDHQKAILDNAPDRVRLERTAPLPNSLFIRGNTAGGEAEDEGTIPNVEELDTGMQRGNSDEGTDFSIVSNRQLSRGDVLRLNTTNHRVRPQLAVYLGTKGVQSFYLLSDGRWYADCQLYFGGYIVSGRVAEHEIARIEAHLPQRTIEYQKVEEGGTVPFTAFGDVPHADARPILAKLAVLEQETEEAKRRYSMIFEQVYNSAAHETEFVFEPLTNLLREHASVEFDELTDGEKVYMVDSAHTDERLMPILERSSHKLGLIPKTMARCLVQVTNWARSYQDAAARAAIGKSVVEELRANPLTGFISKARRLISKSRKIRLPTLECELGPTLEHLHASPGTIERKPSGEEFSSDEKTIIEFLWLVFVRKPAIQNTGSKRSASVASTIIRAVGAYPKFLLDGATGTLFLKELGCMDPWALLHDYNVAVPHHTLNLLHKNRISKEKVDAAVVALGLKPGQEQLPFPDTMANTRKDWGDLEVFCIDSHSTRVVDDGISIEPSDKFIDHYWIHVHIAHISAFLPHDHPVLARANLMGTTMYHAFGSEPYIPFEIVELCSLKPNRPVLTISTLLSPDGSVKDVQVTAGIVRNVITIDKAVFGIDYEPKEATGALSVGNKRVFKQDEPRPWLLAQQEKLERYRGTFDKLRDLTLKRWEARYREDPEHLKMLKLPNTQVSPVLDPRHEIGVIEYNRLFRSEHVVGDPSINLKLKVADYDRVTYPEQSMKHHAVAGAMMLAAESVAAWATKHQVPILYRFSKLGADSTLAKLNSLGPHDFYISTASGESIDISKHIALNMAGYAYVTSPLRRYRDLVNHYQIDAYLKAQAQNLPDLSESAANIQYPRTREQLKIFSEETSDGAAVTAFGHAEKSHWLFTALYRAFYFQEAELPELWDVFIDNPVSLKGVKKDVATMTKGSLTILGAHCEFVESEEGWEKVAKFRQYIPSRIVKIEPRLKLISVKAAGPPTDHPSVPDFAYPELQAN